MSRRAAAWLSRALTDSAGDTGLTAAVRDEVRRHASSATGQGFARAWRQLVGGELPGWALLDPDLLAQVRAWVDTPSFTAERDYLAAHPQLLDADAVAAVQEALMTVDPEHQDRYRALRTEASSKGTAATYQGLVLGELVAVFARAAPATQRQLLIDYPDLATPEARRALAAVASSSSDPAVQVAQALLDLAAQPDHENLLEAAFAALTGNRDLSARIRDTARAVDTTSLFGPGADRLPPRDHRRRGRHRLVLRRGRERRRRRRRSGDRDDQASTKENLVWAPTGGAVWNNVTGKLRIQDFALPDSIGDDHPGDGVEPVDLMPDVHALPGIWTPVKGYTRLLDRLASFGFRRQEPGNPRPGNLLPVAYDWRLSNRYNGQRLTGIVEPALNRWRAQGGRYADAQLVFVCHSMGGLVARWYLEQCGGTAHTRKLITLGTPWRGAGKTVEQLVNGVTPRIGPLHVDLTRFAGSLPSLYQLLPEYACLTDGPRPTRKTTEVPTLPLPTGRVADAMDFYTTLQQAEQNRPASADMTHTIVGTRQPTITTITLTPQRTATALDTFGVDNDYGDGTVPLTSSIGHDQPLDTPLAFRTREHHGNLQRNQQVLDQLEEILTTTHVRRRATQPITLRVHTPDLLPAGQPLNIDVDIDEGDSRHALRVTLSDEHGRLLGARQPTLTAGHAHTSFTDLPPGAHTVLIDSPPSQPSPQPAQPNYGGPIQPVTATTLIWPTSQPSGEDH